MLRLMNVSPRCSQKSNASDVDYVSVKVSAIVANLDVLAFDDSVRRVTDRLRTLYRAAGAATPTTFVNLDMEEFRDLDLTIDAFITVLSEPEFATVDAGIVLQAYLPDSHSAAERLGAWATQRRSEGGGTVKVRLVKGANLAMESAEAEFHGWIAAPYGNKMPMSTRATSGSSTRCFAPSGPKRSALEWRATTCSTSRGR